MQHMIEKYMSLPCRNGNKDMDILDVNAPQDDKQGVILAALMANTKPTETEMQRRGSIEKNRVGLVLREVAERINTATHGNGWGTINTTTVKLWRDDREPVRRDFLPAIRKGKIFDLEGNAENIAKLPDAVSALSKALDKGSSHVARAAQSSQTGGGPSRGGQSQRAREQDARFDDIIRRVLGDAP
jgi:hypothetical protein